jgi:hypothetical protein
VLRAARRLKSSLTVIVLFLLFSLGQLPLKHPLLFTLSLQFLVLDPIEQIKPLGVLVLGGGGNRIHIVVPSLEVLSHSLEVCRISVVYTGQTHVWLRLPSALRLW